MLTTSVGIWGVRIKNVDPMRGTIFTSLCAAVLRITGLWFCAFACFAAPPDPIEYQHGLSAIEPLKYPPDFQHFDYVNPNAPKGGTVRYPEMGTFDSFNRVIDKGRKPMGMEFLYNRGLTAVRLLVQANDENAAFYGSLADGVWVSDDMSEFVYRIRANAYWHDGTPITADDVVFTFETYRDKGRAGIRMALLELDRIEKISEREIYFAIKPGVPPNNILPFSVGRYPIESKRYWAERDVTKTTVEPPLAGGPYRIADFSLGRYIVYERVDDYWGRDLPTSRGRYNFDRIKIDYFRDEAMMVEALKGDVLDIRNETVSKQWVTQYNFPAVQHGYFKKELIYLNRPWGMWGPVIWNLDRKRLQDIRVREALFLMYDFEWMNRVLMHGYYNYANSFFYNSKMAHSGLPSPAELKFLEPLRDQIPSRVFTHVWKAAETTGFGHNRENIQQALALFAKAGWEITDGVMTNVATYEPFTLDFIFISPMNLRGQMPFVTALNNIGIETTARAPERSNWEYRMRNGKFDGGTAFLIPNYLPGLMFRGWFHSQSADLKVSQNWSRVRNPAVDQLIDKVLQARTPEDFYGATGALDRVLLWNFYWIPNTAQPGFRQVYWDRFGRPDNQPPMQRDVWWDTWWWDEEKAARVKAGMAKLIGNQ